MIVDCHTHVWQSTEQLGRLELGDAPRPEQPRSSRWSTRRSTLSAQPEEHWAQSQPTDRVIVLGFKSRYMEAEIPNRYVAEYVQRYPQKLIGFAGIDPTDKAAVDELLAAREALKLRGLTVSPANQDFHPADSRALRVYAEAERLGMPVLIIGSGRYAQHAKMEYARPYLLDEVARSFPRLRLVVAQMGQPWIEETLCLLRKHDHVFADVSGLLERPWQAYNALVLAHQYQVIDKLLFGSDFPFTTAADSIEALYSINQITHGTNLPIVPRESLRGIVERDALGLLGLDQSPTAKVS